MTHDDLEIAAMIRYEQDCNNIGLPPARGKLEYPGGVGRMHDPDLDAEYIAFAVSRASLYAGPGVQYHKKIRLERLEYFGFLSHQQEPVV